MKRFLNVLLVLLVAFAMVGLGDLLAAANGTVNNHTTGRDETVGMVFYSGSFTTTATDCVGTHYTKAMYIAPFSGGNAYWRAVMSDDDGGTEDVNVYVQYSNDLSNWVLGTAASGVIKDQLTTTAIYDTLNIQVGAQDLAYKQFKWMRLKFVGQAGNPIGTTGSWTVAMRKPAGLEQQNGLGLVTNYLP